MAKKTQVTVIPATISMFNQTQLGDPSKKRRVAAYARVSTDKEEQENSFRAQVDYYTKYIAERDDWDMIHIYTDEGITGTSIKKREGFKQMVKDGLAGKFDLLITKSVSRFARNTVDSLNTIRAFKDVGVEVYFENENTWTFDGKGELMITIMSSMAQEEARHISENTTWGQRKRFADGKVSMSYSQFLGYERGADGTPKVVESEAKIVRNIYQMYLGGATIRQICKTLMEQGILTPRGNKTWAVSTVKSILSNEKYKGDALLQKSFTVDFLTKRTKKNEGEVQQFYVENSHPGIVQPEIFDMVQAEMIRNSELGTRRNNVSCFSCKIFCPVCGSIFGRKTWRTTVDGVHKPHLVWQCNGKYKERGKSCPSTHISEEELELAFIKAFNQITADRERYIDALEPMLDLLTDTTSLDNEETILHERAAGLYAKLMELINDNARRTQDQSEYKKRYDDLHGRYETVKNSIVELTAEKQLKQSKRHNILRFIEILRQRNDLVLSFDEALFRTIIDKVIVHSKKNVAVIFKDGHEVFVDARLKKFEGYTQTSQNS